MLVELLVRGDSSAIESLYERHSRVLYSLALRIMGDPRDAEEVLQDTFLQLWKKSLEFDLRRGSLIAWLLTITRHRAISRIRARRNRIHRESPFHDDILVRQNLEPSHLDQHIARELVSAAFAGLPDNQKNAIALAYFDGFTVEEIASRTQAPLGTTKTRLRSGLKKMKRILSNPIAPGSSDWRQSIAILEDILITDELMARECRERDSGRERRALDSLAEIFASSPQRLIDTFLQIPLDLCHAGTGGLSLLETNSGGEQVFRWTNLSGVLAKHV